MDSCTLYPINIPLRNDGKPDLRYKAAKEFVASDISKERTTNPSKLSIQSLKSTSHSSKPEIIEQQEQKVQEQQKLKLIDIGKMITIVKDDFVSGTCKAVRQGLIILNDDRTINPQSPLNLDGIIKIRSDGKLDRRLKVMQYIDDRSSKLKVEDYIGEQSKEDSLIINTELFFGLLEKKPGLRSSNYSIEQSLSFLSEKVNPKVGKDTRTKNINNNKRIIELIDGNGRMTRELRTYIQQKVDAIHDLQQKKKTTADIEWIGCEMENLVRK
ncbi:MAG: hypothetical protein EZS28_022356 [Streblomastix strix]|uniref:Uncharacterized protein n=1 Tax=Streblomastix strix TaxID=222440 RepID=A0A5J4VHR6_9EUKA|nr:MAG: hypothetical protein EZS28_022356 [Streblomastix strix]